ncbi:hypothetical protein HG530_009535 [Fusarium avenaceum]|nr:hypothetical protein HG530_009535 [Fusarium avenaceum]
MLRRVPPDLGPVNIRVSTRGSSNNLKHVLSRIDTWRTLRSSVANKVVDQNIRVFAYVAEVDGLATRQQKQSIEALEEHSGGLMDGAEDSLPVVRKLLHQVADRPRGLAIKSRRRLVEEQ